MRRRNVMSESLAMGTGLRWSARALSLLILAVWGFFLMAHAVGDAGMPSRPLAWIDWGILGTVILALAGLAAAWRWEVAGALVSLVAIAVCAMLNWRVLIFPGTLIPLTALLFLAAAWTRGTMPGRA
jgi:hypothetical protein